MNLSAPAPRIVVFAIAWSIITSFAIVRAQDEPSDTAPTAPVKAEANWVPLINYAVTFSKLQEVQDLTKQAFDQRTKLMEEDARRTTEVRNLIAERNAFAQDSPQYKDKDAQLKRLQAAHEAWAIDAAKRLAAEQSANMLRVWKQVEAVTTEIATARKIPTGTPTGSRPPLTQDAEKMSADRLRALLAERQLYRPRDSQDISGEVLMMMNMRYGMKKAAMRPAAPATTAPATKPATATAR